MRSLSHQRGTIGAVLWFWVVVLVAVIGAIAVVAAGRGDSMAEVYDDRRDTTVPTGRPLTADDLRAVRFNTGVRGYRMDEVDALLARLEAEALDREDRADDGDPPDVEPTVVLASDDSAVLDLIREGSPADRAGVETQPDSAAEAESGTTQPATDTRRPLRDASVEQPPPNPP
jgi:DivIVA domain-containing protein